MKEIEEQIAEIIKQDHYSNSKIPFTETGHRILSEVTIEVQCSDFHTGTIKYIVVNGVEVCEKCKGTGTQTITLKQAIERLK